MKTYTIDTHVHTAEVSSCGKVKSEEVIRLYIENKYDTIIITDHYFFEYFDNLSGLTWEEKTDNYLSGYRAAKKEGDKRGLNVLLGIELRFDNCANDYLVYGMDEDFLYKNPELYKMRSTDFYAFSRAMGLAVFQAHPFRDRMVVEDNANIDGIEVINGNPRHNSSNRTAYKHAVKNNLKMLSGSDFHQGQDIARGGILSSIQPASSIEFADYILREKSLTLLGDIDS